MDELNTPMVMPPEESMKPISAGARTTHKSLCQQIVSAQSWPRMNGFIMWRLPTMCTQPESGCVDLSEWRR